MTSEAAETSDTELMQRAAAGDADAFATIYDRNAPIMLAVARRMLPAGEEAVDLLHDVFLEAWQHVREYDPTRATTRTWLLVRLRSRALDRRTRSARGAAVLSTMELTASTTANVPTAEQARLRTLRRLLGALNDDVREVLELTYFEGMTAIEIGARLELPVGTVRSRLGRGLDKLRSAWGELEATHV